MADFTKDDARVRTKRLWLFVAGPVVALGVVSPIFVGVMDGRLASFWLVVSYGAVLGLPFLWERWWRERRGRLRADERGLWLDEGLVVARSALRHAHVVRRDGVAYVHLQRVLRPVEVVVQDEEEGAALLAAMRLDAGRSVGQYRLNLGTCRGAWIRVGRCLPIISSSLTFAE